MTWYRIKAEGSDTAEIMIYGDIGEDWMGESVSAKKFVEEIGELKDQDIVVRINSYGGSVSDGVAIYNAIRRHPKGKTVEVDGVAVSIASLIAMAGDTVRIAANALFMVHAPWGLAVGNATEMRKYADRLDKYAEAMATSYAEKTGRSEEEIFTDLLGDGEDHWYTAEEALAAGFADEIVDRVPEEEAARFRAAAFSRFNIPAAIAAAYKPKEASMTKKTTPAADPAGPAPTNQPAEPTNPTNVVDIEKAAQARERERIKARNGEIQQIFARFMGREGVSDLYNSCIADVGLTTDQARDKLLAKLGEGSEPLGSAHVELGEDARDKKIRAVSSAVAARMGIRNEDGEDGANPYRGRRLHEIARACLRDAGMNVDALDQTQVAEYALSRNVPRGAQTTSDFPVILENTMHKLVLMGYQAQEVTYTRFCAIGDVSDFRDWNRLVPGLIGNLDEVSENGEYENKNIPDALKQSIRATRKGNIINVTPEVIVNDDIGYIQTMARSLGQAGPRAIERAVYALIQANPVLSDGKALFHADHGNLASAGGVPSVEALDAGRQGMASQKAPGEDEEFLDLRPAVALAPLSLGGSIRVIVNAVYDPDTPNKLQRPNMVNGIVRDVVDSPRLSGKPWYLFADPAVAPVIEVVFLDGQRAPRVTEEINFRTSGIAFKVEMPFGVGAIGYHGAWKNPGE